MSLKLPQICMRSYMLKLRNIKQLYGKAFQTYCKSHQLIFVVHKCYQKAERGLGITSEGSEPKSIPLCNQKLQTQVEGPIATVSNKSQTSYTKRL